MTAHRVADSGKAERELLRTAITILESRASVSDTVVISGPFARMVARHLKTLLLQGG